MKQRQPSEEVRTNAKQAWRFFTVHQVAEILSVSTRSVRRWIANGELMTHKFNRQIRIADADLRAFLAAKRATHA